MQENFEVKGMAPCPSPISDECIIARKVYGKCRQQDCLRPFDSSVVTPPLGAIEISSSRLGEASAISGAALVGTITPGEIIAFNTTVTSLRIVPNSFRVSDIRVSVSPSAFGQDGFYDVTIVYTFSYGINLLDATGNPISVALAGDPAGPIFNICAYTTYTKVLSLFGGEASEQTITSADTIFGPSSTYVNVGNTPFAFVQAIGNPLQQPIIGVYESIPGTAEYHADIVIGLFTIIKLYRIVNMTVSSAGDCDIPECEPITGDPCEFFNSLPFPFEDFDPPTTL
ncbi:hypothetical protein [Clostridium sp. C8-1-8]|uniref:hypothetical protein n=1 Tax=Clostridium sp. C8-1-8 TaxID=2698831 RepID=UPI0013716A6C|nr:hypothetical protein [Clostridium sp. C8-1-8]